MTKTLSANDLIDTLTEYGPLFLKLMGADGLTIVEENETKPHDATVSVFPWGEVWVPLAGHIDMEKESNRIEKELCDMEKDVKGIKAKLTNPDYVNKAPKEIVEETRKHLADIKMRIESLTGSLATLKTISN